MCVASFARQVWSGHMGKRVAMIGRDNDMATAVALDTLADTVAVGYHSGIVRVFLASIGKQNPWFFNKYMIWLEYIWSVWT